MGDFSWDLLNRIVRSEWDYNGMIIYIYIHIIIYSWLVVWNHGFLNDFPYIGNGIIIPIDEVIFFRGVGQPPAR